MPFRSEIFQASHDDTSDYTSSTEDLPWGAEDERIVHSLNNDDSSEILRQNSDKFGMRSKGIDRATRNFKDKHATTKQPDRTAIALDQKKRPVPGVGPLNTEHPREATTTYKTLRATDVTPWVRRFLEERPQDALLPVPKDFLADGFNFYQLAPVVERIGHEAIDVDTAKRLEAGKTPYPIYRLAQRLLLSEEEEEFHDLPPECIERAAEALYLMIHARFAASPRGLLTLHRVLLSSPLFGRCPRVECHGGTLLPFGPTIEHTNRQLCQRYCPQCGNYWNWWDSKTDGCAWGPSLCHLFLLAYGHDHFPSPVSVVEKEQMTKSVFGFQIHPAAKWGSLKEGKL